MGKSKPFDVKEFTRLAQAVRETFTEEELNRCYHTCPIHPQPDDRAAVSP